MAKHLGVCTPCNGDGRIPDLSRPKGTWYETKTCPHCQGMGWVVKQAPAKW